MSCLACVPKYISIAWPNPVPRVVPDPSRVMLVQAAPCPLATSSPKCLKRGKVLQLKFWI